MPEIFETLLPYIVAIVVALAAAVATLFKLVINNQKEHREKLDEYDEMHNRTQERLGEKLDACEDLHHKSQEKISELSREVGFLEGRVTAVETLSTAVIDAIHKAVKPQGGGHD